MYVRFKVDVNIFQKSLYKDSTVFSSTDNIKQILSENENSIDIKGIISVLSNDTQRNRYYDLRMSFFLFKIIGKLGKIVITSIN